MSGYVYGPVPSRRLGASLGIDLVPRKTCSLNCVYCQLGPTPKTTLERKIYAPVDDVFAQVDRKIKEGPQPDYLTLGGSGEPALHSRFGEIARRLREISDLPNCLLTNGTLFFLPEVRNDCDAIDLIIPSLDAGDE
ncbi:MAG: radical SAM protein, partial [Planctomycetes bacterium]|nr:radical SAM protein [Planctomycetota bacterium]